MSRSADDWEENAGADGMAEAQGVLVAGRNEKELRVAQVQDGLCRRTVDPLALQDGDKLLDEEDLYEEEECVEGETRRSCILRGGEFVTTEEDIEDAEKLLAREGLTLNDRAEIRRANKQLVRSALRRSGGFEDNGQRRTRTLPASLVKARERPDGQWAKGTRFNREKLVGALQCDMSDEAREANANFELGDIEDADFTGEEVEGLGQQYAAAAALGLKPELREKLAGRGTGQRRAIKSYESLMNQHRTALLAVSDNVPHLPRNDTTTALCRQVTRIRHQARARGAAFMEYLGPRLATRYQFSEDNADDTDTYREAAVFSLRGLNALGPVPIEMRANELHAWLVNFMHAGMRSERRRIAMLLAGHSTKPDHVNISPDDDSKDQPGAAGAAGAGGSSAKEVTKKIRYQEDVDGGSVLHHLYHDNVMAHVGPEEDAGGRRGSASEHEDNEDMGNHEDSGESEGVVKPGTVLGIAELEAARRRELDSRRQRRTGILDLKWFARRKATVGCKVNHGLAAAVADRLKRRTAAEAGSDDGDEGGGGDDDNGGDDMNVDMGDGAGNTEEPPPGSGSEGGRDSGSAVFESGSGASGAGSASAAQQQQQDELSSHFSVSKTSKHSGSKSKASSLQLGHGSGSYDSFGLGSNVQSENCTPGSASSAAQQPSAGASGRKRSTPSGGAAVSPVHQRHKADNKPFAHRGLESEEEGAVSDDFAGELAEDRRRALPTLSVSKWRDVDKSHRQRIPQCPKNIARIPAASATLPERLHDFCAIIKGKQDDLNALAENNGGKWKRYLDMPKTVEEVIPVSPPRYTFTCTAMGTALACTWRAALTRGHPTACSPQEWNKGTMETYARLILARSVYIRQCSMLFHFLQHAKRVAAWVSSESWINRLVELEMKTNHSHLNNARTKSRKWNDLKRDFTAAHAEVAKDLRNGFTGTRGQVCLRAAWCQLVRTTRAIRLLELRGERYVRLSASESEVTNSTVQRVFGFTAEGEKLAGKCLYRLVEDAAKGPHGKSLLQVAGYRRAEIDALSRCQRGDWRRKLTDSVGERSQKFWRTRLGDMHGDLALEVAHLEFSGGEIKRFATTAQFVIDGAEKEHPPYARVVFHEPTLSLTCSLARQEVDEDVTYETVKSEFSRYCRQTAELAGSGFVHFALLTFYDQTLYLTKGEPVRVEGEESDEEGGDGGHTGAQSAVDSQGGASANSGDMEVELELEQEAGINIKKEEQEEEDALAVDHAGTVNAEAGSETALAEIKRLSLYTPGYTVHGPFLPLQERVCAETNPQNKEHQRFLDKNTGTLIPDLSSFGDWAKEPYKRIELDPRARHRLHRGKGDPEQEDLVGVIRPDPTKHFEVYSDGADDFGLPVNYGESALEKCGFPLGTCSVDKLGRCRGKEFSAVGPGYASADRFVGFAPVRGGVSDKEVQTGDKKIFARYGQQHLTARRPALGKNGHNINGVCQSKDANGLCVYQGHIHRYAGLAPRGPNAFRSRQYGFATYAANGGKHEGHGRFGNVAGERDQWLEGCLQYGGIGMVPPIPESDCREAGYCPAPDWWFAGPEEQGGRAVEDRNGKKADRSVWCAGCGCALSVREAEGCRFSSLPSGGDTSLCVICCHAALGRDIAARRKLPGEHPLHLGERDVPGFRPGIAIAELPLCYCVGHQITWESEPNECGCITHPILPVSRLRWALSTDEQRADLKRRIPTAKDKTGEYLYPTQWNPEDETGDYDKGQLEKSAWGKTKWIDTRAKLLAIHARVEKQAAEIRSVSNWNTRCDEKKLEVADVEKHFTNEQQDCGVSTRNVRIERAEEEAASAGPVENKGVKGAIPKGWSHLQKGGMAKHILLGKGQ